MGMSLREFELSWDRQEEKLVARGAQLPEFAKFIYLAGLVVFIFFLTPETWNSNYPEWSSFYFVTTRFYLTVASILLSPLVFYFPSEKMAVGVMLAIWGFFLYQIKVFSIWGMVYPLFWICLFLGLKKSRLSPGLIVGLGVAMFLALIYSVGYLGVSGEALFLRSFWFLRPEMALLVLIQSAFLPQHSRELLGTLLLPTQLSNPTPYPLSSSSIVEEKNRIWWKGALRVFVSILLFYSLSFVARTASPSAALRFFYYGIFITAVMNMIPGIARLCGYAAPDACRFVFLARSPLDVWRRSSIYIYQFVLDFIFLPVARRFRSVAVAWLVAALFVFVETFLFHEVGIKAFYATFFPQFSTALQNMKPILFGGLLFVVLWVTLCAGFHYLMLFLRRFFPEFMMSFWGEVFQVLLTQSLMVGVFHLLGSS